MDKTEFLILFVLAMGFILSVLGLIVGIMAFSGRKRSTMSSFIEGFNYSRKSTTK